MAIEELLMDAKDFQKSIENLDYNDPLYSILKTNLKAKGETERLFPGSQAG